MKKEIRKFSILNSQFSIQKGFSVLEVILAAAIFVTFATAAVVVVISGIDNNRLGGEMTVANQFNTEGMEAVRSIKNQSWTTFISKADAGNTGVTNGSGTWAFSGTSDTLSSDTRFSRAITVSCIQRDGGGNISGSVVCTDPSSDPNTKKVTVRTSWNFTSSRPESVEFTDYLTNWEAPIVPPRGGMLVYGDGGITLDTVRYKIYNATTDTWTSPSSIQDIPSTNRALRAVRLYSSSTRNEKILISRYYDGSSQYIYAQVYDGITSAWGNVQLLSSWAAINYLDVRNFDGVYLTNGNFMAIYRDGTTTIPKYRIWDDVNWGPQTNTTDVGGIPNYIVARARPDTNEVMLVTYDQLSDTNTAYFNGTSWSPAATQHAQVGPTATKEHVDFAWSQQDPATKGALVYPSTGTDTTVNLKIWTADGLGGGSWSGTVDSAASGGRLGAIAIDGRKGTEEWLSCQKDASSDIYCFRANSIPEWAPSTVLTTTSDTGIQRSFDIAYEAATGTEGLAVYSNNNSIPVYRLYTASFNSFGPQINLTTSLGVGLETVRTRPLSDNNDIMIIMANTNQDLYTIVWNGDSNTVYTSGGKTKTSHGLNGSSDPDFWYDFVWDRF